jgi:hypothetical protein
MTTFTYIYALIDPFDHQVFYIGKTSTRLSSRLQGHIYHSRKRRTPKERRIDDLLGSGKRPHIVELVRLTDPTFEEVSEAEQAWIDFYRLTVSGLTNVGYGGQGGQQSQRIEWTPERDAWLGRLSDTLIAQKIGCDRKSVEYRRLKLGIPRCPQTNYGGNVGNPDGANRKNLPDWVISKLGTMPDYKLAELANCSKKCIGSNRRRRGILAYAEATGNNGQFKPRTNQHPGGGLYLRSNRNQTSTGSAGKSPS